MVCHLKVDPVEEAKRLQQVAPHLDMKQKLQDPAPADGKPDMGVDPIDEEMRKPPTALIAFGELEAMTKNALRQYRTTERQLRSEDIERLSHRYDTMKDLHDSQAWKYAISLIGAGLGIASGAFDNTDSRQQMLKSAGSMFEHGGQFTVKFDEGEQKRLEGLIQRIHEALNEENRTNQEIDEFVRDIHGMLEQARMKVVEATKDSIKSH